MAIVYIIFAWLASCGAEFADELQGYDQSCLGEDRFQCADGTCIPQEQYCDGRVQCLDASDESFCPDHTPDPEYCNSTSHFLCVDGKKCIPNLWLCNKLSDCDDGSDEVNCTDTLQPAPNATCKGFVCDKTKCISEAWSCDGVYDCEDRSDESQEICKENAGRLKYLDMDICMGALNSSKGDKKHYRCIDSSFCLPAEMMCDGMPDCRDGSDEANFCKNWHTVCSSSPCQGNATCVPERFGFSCVCPHHSLQSYNFTTHQCEDVDECAEARPYCSHSCVNYPTHYKCFCDEGYMIDEYEYLCHAKGPEAILFYSTKSEIGYVKVKTKEQVTLATGIKQAHGVTSDGKYIYWVETAQGHQAIMRAHMDNVDGTTEVLVGLGLEDPGDIALDWLGGHFYFSDAERGIIAVCRTDGFICTTLPARTKSPRFVTLDVKNGNMFWGDWFGVPLIMISRMDGTRSKVLVDRLSGFATGLTVDAPNGRLYYVDRTIYVVKIDNKQVYSLFKDPFNHPYAIAVFENTVYWSDWTSRSIQTIDKVVHNDVRRQLVTMNAPVFDMHIYHPVLIDRRSNPCSGHNCSHLCLVSSNATHSCACPDGMELGNDQSTCYNIKGFRPHYLVVSAGSSFTRVQYNSLGNPEAHATHFDIGWVHAMAYDSRRDTLYVYDGQQKTINSINMTEFSLGVTHPVLYGLVDVVDMDYDFVTDTLYILDAGKRFVEVFSLRNKQRALLYRFRDEEIPVSFCVMPDYGRMLVAIRDSVYSSDIHIDTIGLDGSGRKPLIMNDLAGPHIRLRYSHEMDSVFIADEGNNIIDYMSPEGTGRERFRSLSSSVTGLSITDTYAFWTDRRTPRLFWADVHDVTHRVRRIEFSLFPNNTQLHIQATSSLPNPNSTLMSHPCLTSNSCSDICVQTSHSYPSKGSQPVQLGYKCLCPPSLLLVNGACTKLKSCKFDQEYYCHKSNDCVLKTKRCDGNKDCTLGEDEEGCDVKPIGHQGDDINQCSVNEISCNGKCIDKNLICTPSKKYDLEVSTMCQKDQFHCRNTFICLDRSQLCNTQRDCPDSSDEDPATCDTWTCLDMEFTCTSGSCIQNSFRCDGEEDCPDGSDEENCDTKICSVGHFQCRNKQCVEIRQRCDGIPDCIDNTDELDCEEPVTEKDEVLKPHCTEEEYACELNRSICIPATARCNKKSDCPGGSDELDCDDLCAPRGLFKCKQESKCLHRDKICNSAEDCNDGSDELPESCILVNRTSFVHLPPLFPAEECRHGFQCGNGECMEWHQVCDKAYDCFDGTDENGRCNEACQNHTCEFTCHPTPKGQHCDCPLGLQLDKDLRSCADIDECAGDVCSQYCHNVKGSFLCSCYHGYAIRSDHRSCKAVSGSMSILYVSGNTVRSLSADGTPSMQFYDDHTPKIMDIDADVRRNLIYVAIPDAQKLVAVSGPINETIVTNVGTPIRVSVDWVTGNVYFIDKEEGVARVCNVPAMRCAKLHKLPLAGDAKVTALVVDPGSHRMFYCITRDDESESTVWSASLAGREVVDLATFGNCTGLAVDSFGRRLYVAETGPAQITRMDFDGERHKKVLFGHPQLEAPHGLVIFEDWIYFLVANSVKLSRCQLYGQKTCEPYIYRMFDANTFVIRHNSIQRDDIKNVCDGFECSNVCVIDHVGPHCLCNNGELAVRGQCPVPDKSQLPQFNGGTQYEFGRVHSVTYIVVGSIVVLFLVYLSIYFYYVRAKKRARARNYLEVRFQNVRSSELTPTGSADAAPVFGIPGRTSTSQPQTPRHEFVNPFEFMRQVWTQSSKRKRPVQGIESSVAIRPPVQSPQEPESDDDRMQIISSPSDSLTPPARLIDVISKESKDEASTSVQPPTPRHEYVNPFDFLRQVWDKSTRKGKPSSRGTADLDVPNLPEDQSHSPEDPESDDDRMQIIPSPSDMPRSSSGSLGPPRMTT